MRSNRLTRPLQLLLPPRVARQTTNRPGPRLEDVLTWTLNSWLSARIAQLVEHFHGKEGVTSSSLVPGFCRLHAPMDFALTDEQSDFVAAIRDFCERECGTQEQRERLTDGYTEHHNFELYKQMAELGWLGVTIPEEYGGSGGSMLDACLFMEETSRGLAPIGGYATTLIVAGATQRFGTEEQKAEILGGIARGAVEAIAMTEPEAGSDVGSLTTSAERVDGGFVLNGQKVFMLQRPHLRPRARRLPHHQGRVQARGPDDDLGPARRRRDGGGPDRHDGRPRDQPPLLHRLRGPGRRRARRGRPGLDAADGRPQRRAADPRRDDARHRPARLRRRPRLRQGAQAVRPPDRLLPGAPAPPRRPGDRPRGGPPDDPLGRHPDRRGPGPDAAPARPRW